jgi:predicted metal-dependent hydrolase
MKSKEFVLSEQTTVRIIKRSTSRHVRLSISPSGEIKVSQPTWLPYKVGLDFAKSKLVWIEAQKPEINLLTNSQAIGKNHHLKFETTNKSSVTTRLTDLEAIVFLPSAIDSSSKAAQDAARRVAKKALLSQGNKLLPQRTQQLADKYDYDFNELKVKSLKSRWGSCDSNKNITLSLYLMQLPWPLIDYVIIHELNHTKVMQHGPKFWNLMGTKLPEAKQLRKEIKQYKAHI